MHQIDKLPDAVLDVVLADLAQALEAKGYVLKGQNFNGDIQVIKVDGDSPEAVADPRGRGVTRTVQ